MKALEKRRKAEDELAELRKARAGHEAAILGNMRRTRFAVKRARDLGVPMRQVEELTGLSRATLYRRMDGAAPMTIQLRI